MSKVCDKCGKRPVAGRTYARKGLAKAKGGVGRKITGKTNRRFLPNIQIIRVRETNGTVKRIRVCAKCLKTGLRNGSISKATRKPRPPKVVEVVAPEFAPAALERDMPTPDDAGRDESEAREATDRIADEVDAAYDEEKAVESEQRGDGFASDVPDAPDGSADEPAPPAGAGE